MVDDLNEYFMIMGPAFEVFIGLEEDGVDINLLDVEDVLGGNQMMELVTIFFSEGNGQAAIPYYIIFLDYLGVLRQYKLGSKEAALPYGQPCGLSSISNSYTLQGGFIFTDGEVVCYCDGLISSCSVISPQQLPVVVSQQTASLGQYAFTLS